jgi:hydroxyacylglutathione hydrolase
MNFSSSSSPSFSTTDGLTIETFVCGPLQTNVYLLLDPVAREAVIIDPSIETGEPLQRAMEWRASGIRLTAIWNTHGHFDHVYDNARWKKEFGVPIYAHPADAFFLEHLREQSLWFGLPAPEITTADFEINVGSSLQVGAYHAQILDLPGHSPGSVGFYFEPSAVCISGDVLFAGSVGRTDLPACSEADLANSVRQLYALPPQTQILPGHGESTTVGDEMRTNPVARQLLAKF